MGFHVALVHWIAERSPMLRASPLRQLGGTSSNRGCGGLPMLPAQPITPRFPAAAVATVAWDSAVARVTRISACSGLAAVLVSQAAVARQIGPDQNRRHGFLGTSRSSVAPMCSGACDLGSFEPLRSGR